MSKLAEMLLNKDKEDKYELISKLSISTEYQSDSKFLTLFTTTDNTPIEYLGWGENHKPIGIFQDGDTETDPPVLSLHLDSKETLATQQLEALLQALNQANYFKDNKQLILLGDLNINLSNKEARIKLADILEQNNLTPNTLAFEPPVERERSIEIALNQQPHKGGQKKTDIKNIIFLLHQRQLDDALVLDTLNTTYASLPAPQKMGKDGLDHNPVALKHNNTLYVSFSNLPTQENGEAFKNDVIMTAEAQHADLSLRNHIKSTIENVFKIEINHLHEYASPLQKMLEQERRNASSEADFAINLIDKMKVFIDGVIQSNEFDEYAKIRVKKEFSDGYLRKELLGDLFNKQSDSDYSSVDAILSDLNPEHGVAKAIRQILIDDNPYAMKVERLLTNFFEMISPQPNNGYEPSLITPAEMESSRVDLIRNLIDKKRNQYPEISQIRIYCNDTRENDYLSFPALLTNMLEEHARPINYLQEKKDAIMPVQRYVSCFDNFFKSCCSNKNDIVPKRDSFIPQSRS